MPEAIPPVLYEGRHEVAAAGVVELGFPGVTAHLRFRGRGLRLRATAGQDGIGFDVLLDGEPPRDLTLRAGPREYEVTVAGPDAEHRVAFVRRNESWQGACSIDGWSTDGEFLPAPALPARRLQFIGDSVTGGEMNAWEPGRARDDRRNSNARLAFGMLLARRLGAQCHLVSYGGRGVIRDWQGRRDVRNAPEFYELARPDGPAVPWDHGRYVPDAVGIQLGTNDFSPGLPPEDEFVAAYAGLVGRVLHLAPRAFVFLMESPILRDDPAAGPKRTVLRRCLDATVGRVANPRVVVAPLAWCPGVPGDGHPTGAEHVAMADALEPLLRRALGW